MRERMITIIGAGLAGLSAAVKLAEQNTDCRLVSAQISERAQSVLAEGGINAALDVMGEQDTTAEHFSDTMKGGVYLADPAAVEGLTGHAPEIVRHLAELGVPFPMNEYGEYVGYRTDHDPRLRASSAGPLTSSSNSSSTGGFPFLKHL